MASSDSAKQAARIAARKLYKVRKLLAQGWLNAKEVQDEGVAETLESTMKLASNLERDLRYLPGQIDDELSRMRQHFGLRESDYDESD